MLVTEKEVKYRQSIIREIEEQFFYNQLKTEFDKILGIKQFQIHSNLGMEVGKYEDVITNSIKQIEEHYKQSKLKHITEGSGVGRRRYTKYQKGKNVGLKHKKKVLDFIDEIGRDTFLKYGLVYSQTETVGNKVYMFDGIVPTKNEKFKKFEVNESKIESEVKKYQLEKHQLIEYNRYIFIRDYFDKKYDDIYFMFVGWYRKKMIIEQFQLTNQTNKLNEFLLNDFIDYIIRKVDVKEDWDLVIDKLWNKKYKIGRFIQTNINWKKYINKEEGELFKKYYQNLNMDKDVGFLFKTDTYTFKDFERRMYEFLEYLHNPY